MSRVAATSASPARPGGAAPAAAGSTTPAAAASASAAAAAASASRVATGAPSPKRATKGAAGTPAASSSSAAPTGSPANKNLIGMQGQAAAASPTSVTPGKRSSLNKRLSLQKQGGLPASSALASQPAPAAASPAKSAVGGGGGGTNLPKINTGGNSQPPSPTLATANANAAAGASSRFAAANPSPPLNSSVTYAQPPSPSSRGSPGGTLGNSTSGASPANATIVLRRPPSPLSTNLLSIGLQSSPGHSRRNSNGSTSGAGGAGGAGQPIRAPSPGAGAGGGHPGHVRTPSGTLGTGLAQALASHSHGIPLPLEEGGMAPVTPRSVAGVSLNDTPFDAVDDMVLGNASYREVFRIVRMIAAQPSCDQQVLVLEKHTKHLIHADHVRVLLVTRHGFTHPTLSQALSLDQGLASHCIHRRETVNLTNPAADGRFNADTDQLGEKAPPAFYACIPVEGDPLPNCSGPRDVVALVQLFRERPASEGANPFSAVELKIVQRLADFVGSMLLRARQADRAYALYNTSVSTQKRSAALLDVAKALSSETRLSDVVSVIVSQVPEMLDCDRCTLFFVDKDRGELIVTRGASHGRHKNLVSWIFGQSNAPELPFAPGENEIRFSMANGLAGHVARSGETLCVDDAHKDPRFNSTFDRETGYRTRSLLCVPMIDGKGETIGVVQCINKNPLYPRFDAQDETLLKTFSAQAAVAVRNSRLFEKTESALRQSDALLEIANALSSELKIEALISIICAKVQVLLHCERCTVYILDKEKKELYTSASMSFGMGAALPIDKDRAKLIHFPMDRGIAGAVATTGQPLNIPDAYKEKRFNQAMDKETGFRTRAILCIAIKNSAQEVCGVLQVMNKLSPAGVAGGEWRFNEDDEQMLRAFAAQAAVAIENSKLFSNTEAALNHALSDQRNLKFMLSVTKNLFSDMHLTSMIDQMTMQVHHLLKADDCALYLVDGETKTFWLAKEETGSGDPNIHKHSLSVGIVGAVASTGDTVRISTEAHKDPRFSPLVDQRKGKTTHSILCCPIISEGSDGTRRIVGVISVRDEKDRGGFEAEEEKLLKVFSAQAAVAITNSKKFSSIMEQNEFKESDHTAADYLKKNRGMNLADDDIAHFQYRMEDIVLKGAIGNGSYGEVYRAQVGGAIVAVKRLHVRNLKAEQVDAFCKEASLMCQLKHPNIVGFIGAVTEPSNLAILTQFCARGSLADLLLEHKIDMNFKLKMKFAIDAAKGMVYLHTQSNPAILHRDLKSDNLLVTQDWVVKVADFGLTRFISEKKQMTQVGTPMWMAPEIIMGRKYTEKADVYAFGIILWEILTRLEPYEDKEPMQIVVEVVNDNLRPHLPAPFVDSPLVPLMKDCWHENPDIRPSFEKILERLRRIDDSIPPDDNSTTGVPGSSRATKPRLPPPPPTPPPVPAPPADEDAPMPEGSPALSSSSSDASHRMMSPQPEALSRTETEWICLCPGIVDRRHNHEDGVTWCWRCHAHMPAVIEGEDLLAKGWIGKGDASYANFLADVARGPESLTRRRP